MCSFFAQKVFFRHSLINYHSTTALFNSLRSQKAILKIIMNTFKVKNFREAMLQSLKILSNEGVEIIPRGMKTKEIENVLFELSNPQDKVALIEGRKANIFATLAETLWVLGGRNDLDFISHYVPRMEDFSDPNRVLYGGYGPRIQKWHSVNQLEQIYLILKKDNSRFSVLFCRNCRRANAPEHRYLQQELPVSAVNGCVPCIRVVFCR